VRGKRPGVFLAKSEGARHVAKPEWGLKRVCQSCGAKFYDMARSPILCPKCGATFDPDALLKSRRTKVAAVAPPPKPEPEDEIEPAEAEETAADDDDKEEEEAVMEDTSELGEDSEDVADVVEKADGEEER
jgi:uncharacterized protein (TIGR02300 family)